jgi:hypothetical protein
LTCTFLFIPPWFLTLALDLYPTILYTTMAPSAIDEPAIKAPEQKTYPPAQIFPVKETRFENYIEPSKDGRERALKQPESTAIVIDNGKLGAQRSARGLRQP